MTFKRVIFIICFLFVTSAYGQDSLDNLTWDNKKNQTVKDKVKKTVEQEIAKYEAKLLELQKYLYSIDTYTAKSIE